MYHAKGMGRDTYCFFQSSMNANVHRQLQLVPGHALENSELRLHYQPKFMAPDGSPSSASRRWCAASITLGLLMPDEFIPIVEKTGLDSAGRGCERSLPATGGWEHGIRWSVAVNLSAVQFGHPDLVGTVSDVLRRGLDASYLTLEVTESTAMKNADASLAIPAAAARDGRAHFHR